MSSKTKFTPRNIIITVIVLILFSFMIPGASIFSIVATDPQPTNVGVPTYSSATCTTATATKDIMTPYDMSRASKVSDVYGFSSHVFSCDANVEKCDVSYLAKDTIGALLIYKCPVSVDVSTIDNDMLNTIGDVCTQMYYKKYSVGTDLIIGSKQDVGHFNYNSHVHSDTENLVVIVADKLLGGYVDSGDITISISGQVYSLTSSTDTNLQNIMINSCSLSDMFQSGLVTTQRKTTNEELREALNTGAVKIQDNEYKVGFGQTYNYISRLTAIDFSSQIVQYKGQWVYVDRVGFAMPIEETAPEFSAVRYFADTSKDAEIIASDIECIPGAPMCVQIPSGGFKIDSSVPATCTWYGSELPVGLAPNYIDGNPNEWCTFECVDGLIVSDECQTPQTCTYPELWNWDTQTCDAYGEDSDTGTFQIPPWFIGLIVGVIVFMLFMMLLFTVVMRR